MTSRPKETPQLTFLGEDNKLEIPPRISDSKERETLIGVLTESRLWQRRVRRSTKPHVWLELDTGQTFIFNPDNWQIIKEVYSPETLLPNRINAAIVISPSVTEETLESFTKQLETITTRLSPLGGLFLFEKQAGDQSIGWREELLAEIGLVKKGITTLGDFLFWSARKRKRRRPRKPSDLTKNPYLARQLEKWKRGATRDAEEQGYRIEDSSEAEKGIRNSKFPPRDISNVKLGFGTEIRDENGQLWRVDKKGDWTKIPG